MTSSAIILDESHKLNWVDILTLCSSPSTENFQQISACYGRSGRGWLSKYILDAYLLAIVRVANSKQMEEEFGCLDCEQSSLIGKNKDFKSDPPFADRIFVKNTLLLRKNVFFPILVENHFVLFWYNQKSNQLKLIDSMKSSNKCQTTKLQKFHQAIADFLNRYNRYYNLCKITCTEEQIVTQTDFSSCGVCVCIAVTLICNCVIDGSIIKQTANKNPTSLFRYWILYSLYANSVKCHHLLNCAASATLKDFAVGIKNIGNSCWFNSLVQAFVKVFKTNLVARNNVMKFRLTATDNDQLALLVQNLVNYKSVSSDFVKDVIKKVCDSCKFTFGAQQDPEEFLVKSTLFETVEKNEISCSIEVTTTTNCTICNKVKTMETSKQKDIVLPLYEIPECESRLKTCFEHYCKGSELRRCNHCCEETMHSITTYFSFLPNILIVCLNRVSHDCYGKKLKKCVVPEKYLYLKQNRSNVEVQYELLSVVVHLGDCASSGHYINYLIRDDDIVTKIDDEQVIEETEESAARIINRNGYLFFYQKVKEMVLSSSDDSDFTQCKPNFCKKKVLRRKRMQSKLQECEEFSTLKTRLEPCLPRYQENSKFNSEWKNENMSKLELIFSKLIEMIETPLSKTHSSRCFLRHRLFLLNQTKKN